jgi:hypothetical protein
MYIDFRRLLLGLLSGWALFWLVRGHNNVVIAQELENRSHIAGESKSIPQPIASLSHDANDGSVRWVERASTYAVPVRFINDNIEVSSREESPPAATLAREVIGTSMFLGETGKCHGSPVVNELGAESQSPSVQISEPGGKKRALYRFTDGDINAFICDATIELEPSDLGMLG